MQNIPQRIEQQIKQEVQNPQVELSGTKEIWTVQKIAIQTDSVIYNVETGETLDILGALVKILNLFEEGLED